jgi:hypothetical protein
MNRRCRIRGRVFVFLSLCCVGVCALAVSGCSFLPGFSFLEQPTLYHLSIGEVATQVSCELQAFTAQHLNDPTYQPPKSYDEKTFQKTHKWVLSDDDVSVKLTLQTDESGYVNFTGVNVAQLGLSSLQNLILAQTSGGIKVPTAAAKLSAKRTRTVVVSFTVSATPLSSKKLGMDGLSTARCEEWDKWSNPITKLYLSEWLNNYFETINFHDRVPIPAKDKTDSTTAFLRPFRQALPPAPGPDQLKIQSIELSTTILLAADLSAGATPNVLGNGSVFIIPVNGLSVDYNPDYSHKIDITLNMCDNTHFEAPCRKPDADTLAEPDKDKKPPSPFIPGKAEDVYTLRKEQCRAYGVLSAVQSGIKPPKSFETPDSESNVKRLLWTCAKTGVYVSSPVDNNAQDPIPAADDSWRYHDLVIE